MEPTRSSGKVAFVDLTADQIVDYLRRRPDLTDQLVSAISTLDTRKRKDVLTYLMSRRPAFAGSLRAAAALSAELAAVTVKLYDPGVLPVPPDFGEHISAGALNVFATSDYPQLRREVTALLERAPHRFDDLNPDALDELVDVALVVNAPRSDNDGLAKLLAAGPVGEQRCARIAARPEPEPLAFVAHTSNVARAQVGARFDDLRQVPDPVNLPPAVVDLVRSLDPVEYLWAWMDLEFQDTFDVAQFEAGVTVLGLTLEQLAARSDRFWAAGDLWSGLAKRYLARFATADKLQVRNPGVDPDLGLEVLLELVGSERELVPIATELYWTWHGTLPELIAAARDLAV